MDTNFYVNVAKVLAHSAIYFTKERYPNAEGIYCNDETAPSPGKNVRKVVDAISKYLPQYGEAIQQQILPNAQAQLDAAQTISPQYYDLLTQLYSQYGPQLAEIGNQIDQQSLTGTGAQNAQLLSQLDRQIDPQYYATRQATSDKLSELLGSINLNNPNAEAERLVNQEVLRSGNITPSAQQTTANALSFGSELDKRRTSLGNAISAATQFLPGSRTGFAQTAAPNAGKAQGMSQFSGVTSPGSEAYGLGSELFGGAMGYASQKPGYDIQATTGLQSAVPESISL